MLAAFKSLLRWLVYTGLIGLAGGLMLLGKADILLVERLVCELTTRRYRCWNCFPARWTRS